MNRAALIAGLAFITLLSIALISGLAFIAQLAGCARSDALFQFFDLDQDFGVDLFVIHMFVCCCYVIGCRLVWEVLSRPAITARASNRTGQFLRCD